MCSCFEFFGRIVSFNSDCYVIIVVPNPVFPVMPHLSWTIKIASQLIFVTPCFINGDSMNTAQSCTVKAVLKERLTSSAPLLINSSVYSAIDASFLLRSSFIFTAAATKFEASRIQ
jgi:hypothetical protein